MLKTVVLFYIFIFKIIWWGSKDQHLSVICFVTNVFTVMFNEFNVFLLNKSINFFQMIVNVKGLQFI